jgi:hypothetical protein
MTQRSILSGKVPQVIIRSGTNVSVKGWDSDRILAESSGIWRLQIKRKKEAIEIEIGGSGQVMLPFESSIRVYSGKSAEVEGVKGKLVVVSGLDLHIREGNILVQASAGGMMDLDCRTVEGEELKISAGRDLRFRLRDLHDVHYLINDLGGKWQTILGNGSTTIQLTAGGDVTLASSQSITGQPPDFLIGKVEYVE